ncbi:toxin-antitoxin system HicB family antitoxin [Pseudomonas sp. SIMBA_041]
MGVSLRKSTLNTCASLGQESEIPFEGAFNVRVGHELH